MSMPIQAPQWTDYLNCPACCREFSPRRSPISLSCGHTLCRPCLKNLIRKQCPFDQSVISMDLEELVVNTALLQLMGYDPPAQPFHPSSIQSLSEQDRRAYDVIVKSLEHLAVFLKYCCTASVNMIGSRLSRPMQRKLVTLLQCALMDEEGRGKAARAARSLGERTVSELILQHQNPQQLSANLWAAVRSRGCQFLGPAMQEEVLKLVLLALEDGSPLSRKVLVMFVVQRLEPHFPQASKTSIGHVVQLLYRASCFKVSKRDSDSSLMQLKEEFRTYECLRREHDAQIVQIATESGLRIAPDQWSALLYGDTLHKSHMQSIIDKLQTPHSFAQSVQELFIALQRTGDPAQLLVMSISLDRLTNIDPSPDAKSPSWQELSQIMSALKDVVSGLVDYIQHHAAARDANHNLKTDRLLDATTQPSAIASLLPGRYKVAMCRDAQARTFCPRGNNCTYAHTEEELERYRRQQDIPTVPQVHPTSPQPMATPPVMQRPVFIYPSRNYIDHPMQQVSPPGRQHGMPDNGDVPDEFGQHARRRQSFESQVIPGLNQPDKAWTYANALVFGANNQKQNGSVSLEPTGSIIQPNGTKPPPVGGIRHPEAIIKQNEVMIHHNRDTTPRDVSVNNLGDEDMHPPPNGGMRSPLNGGMVLLNGGMNPPLNGGMIPFHGSCPLNGGMVPLNGGVRPPFNGGVVPRNGGVRPPFNGGMVPLNGGVRPPLNGGMVPFNRKIAIGHYGNFTVSRVLSYALNNFNGGNHTPITDSRYFPRQPPEKPAYIQPHNYSVPMGGKPAFQGMENMGTDDLPEFKPRQYGANVTTELNRIEAYGQGSVTNSQFEDNWQTLPTPPIENVPRQPMFKFTDMAKNLPEGIYPCDTLPMGSNLANKPRHVYLENQQMPSNYNQPMVVDMPGPSDTAVLADLHQLAVRVTALGSDSETDSVI